MSALPPHFSIQVCISSLLLAALSNSDAYEKFPGLNERQKLVEDAIKLYYDTCEPLRIKPVNVKFETKTDDQGSWPG